MKHTLEKRQYEFCQNWSTFGARLIKRTTLQKCQGPLVAVYIDPTEAYYQDSGIGGQFIQYWGWSKVQTVKSTSCLDHIITNDANSCITEYKQKIENFTN